MFTNLTYKQKLIGLLVLTVLLFLTANKRSFMVAKQSYDQMVVLEEKLLFINSSTQNLSQIQSELDFYDRVIGKQGIEAEEIQQKILDFTTRYEDVFLVNLEEIHIAKSDGFNIITNQLILEGDFNSLLEMVYVFEKEFKFSNIVSVTFNKEKEYQTRVEKLTIKIIFQNYEKTN